MDTGLCQETKYTWSSHDPMRVAQVNHPHHFASSTSGNTIPQLLQPKAGPSRRDSSCVDHVLLTDSLLLYKYTGISSMAYFRDVLTLVMCLILTTLTSAAPLLRMQLCGSELANKLAEICSSYGYNDPFNHAMRLASPQIDNRTPIRLRVRRGVADECCKAGCTLETMEQYCSAPLTPAERARFLQQSQDRAINHIPQDIAAGSLEMRRPAKTREQKNDLVSKGDLEDPERQQNQIPPVIGTINPSYFGIPVILSTRIRKGDVRQDVSN